MRLPDEALPEWAAYALFEATQDKIGAVQSLALRSQPARIELPALSSISKRWGTPSSTLNRGSVSMNEWERPDIYIQVGCAESVCSIIFQSAAARRAHVAELDAAAKAKAGRPSTP
jgi:hypothetical protein